MFASSQQYFSFTTNQSPAVLFSQNKQAPAISHQPNEQAGLGSSLRIFSFFTFFFLFFAKNYGPIFFSNLYIWRHGGGRQGPTAVGHGGKASLFLKICNLFV
jgi:hypothetical protein